MQPKSNFSIGQLGFKSPKKNLPVLDGKIPWKKFGNRGMLRRGGGRQRFLQRHSEPVFRPADLVGSQIFQNQHQPALGIGVLPQLGLMEDGQTERVVHQIVRRLR